MWLPNQCKNLTGVSQSFKIDFTFFFSLSCLHEFIFFKKYIYTRLTILNSILNIFKPLVATSYSKNRLTIDLKTTSLVHNLKPVSIIFTQELTKWIFSTLTIVSIQKKLISTYLIKILLTSNNKFCLLSILKLKLLGNQASRQYKLNIVRQWDIFQK